MIYFNYFRRDNLNFHVMKKMYIAVLTILIFACQPNKPKEAGNFEVIKGTNIAHWLSQSHKRGADRERFFTKADVENIAQMGFDHIRLPIDEEQMWDENGNRHEDAFQLMANCIDWCAENNLRVIVDLHILRSHHFNAKEKPLWTDPKEQEKFCGLWRDLSKALVKYPNSLVAYELMNEAVADDPEQWNELIASAVKAVRELEPNRKIVIGSNKWQQVQTFDVLKVPENDPNIILSFHFYEPFLLTHWHSSWTSLRDYTGPVHYPGIILTPEEFDNLPDSIKPLVEGWVNRAFDKHWISGQLEKPMVKAKALGLPLYCGEFGVITGPSEADAYCWYRDMVSLFEENGIGYANWNYKSGSFGLIDGEDNPRDTLIAIVSGN